MKKYISLFLLCLWALCLQAQQGSIDPENPGDPSPLYTLRINVSPAAGGTPNFTKKMVTAGDRVYIDIDLNKNFTLLQWVYGDSILTTNETFYFTMPADDVVLTAQLLHSTVFDPESPDDPASPEMNRKHLVTIFATPSTAGEVYPSSFYLKRGEQKTVYAYPSSGYEFMGWYVNDELQSDNNPLVITMKDQDLAITAKFQFNPTPPNDPGVNSYDPITGELVIDRFQPGRLSEALYDLLRGIDVENARFSSFTIIGKMASVDFYTLENFMYGDYVPDIMDLGQTSGFSIIPEEAFEGEFLPKKIILPSCVQSIEIENFISYYKNTLEELVLYALVPPTVKEYSFIHWDEETGDYVLPNMIVKVPASAVPLYQTHEFWSQFPIHAIDAATAALKVELPQNTEAKYKNMSLEVKNLQSEQVRKFIITDHTSYTFDNLFQGTTYEISVKNAQGRNLGLKNVTIPNNDTILVLSQLKQLVDLNIQVLLPNNENVTNHVRINWYSATGELIQTGTKLDKQIEGDTLKYEIELDEYIGIHYIQPNVQLYIINDDSIISHELQKVSTQIVKGHIRDSITGKSVTEGQIAILQTINNYDRVVCTRCNQHGEFEITIPNLPYNLTITANNYLTKNINQTDTTLDIILQPLNGYKIPLQYTYINCDGEQSQDIFSDNIDYRNIVYHITNLTTQKKITNFEVQNGMLIFLDNIAIGDSISIDISSKINKFKPITTSYNITSSPLPLKIVIKQYGELQIMIENSYNKENIGLLYDENGLLYTTDFFDENKLLLSNIPDGNYTLILLGYSNLYSSIQSIESIKKSELKENDYICRDISIQSGKRNYIYIDSIPTLDESLLYYTNEQTMFIANKSIITKGDYITLKSKVEFKERYLPNVSNVKLLINISSDCKLVDGSVMSNRELQSYELQQDQIIIPIDTNSGTIRLCILPVTNKDIALNAFVQFDISEKSVIQPIGVVNFIVKKLSLDVPSLVIAPQIKIEGVAPMYSKINIYDGTDLIGTTNTYHNTKWSLLYTLDTMCNYSTHDIHAKIYTTSGDTLESVNKTVEYSSPLRKLKTLTMIYNNQKYVMDFAKQQQRYLSFTYDPSISKFEFLIEFTSPIDSLIQNVDVNIITTDKQVRTLRAYYDMTRKVFVAQSNSFSSSSLPQNINVTYDDMYQDMFQFLDLDTYIDYNLDAYKSYDIKNVIHEMGATYFQVCSREENKTMLYVCLCDSINSNGAPTMLIEDTIYSDKNVTIWYDSIYAIHRVQCLNKEDSPVVTYFSPSNFNQNDSIIPASKKQIPPLDIYADRVTYSDNIFDRAIDRRLYRILRLADRVLQCNLSDYSRWNVNRAIHRLRHTMLFTDLSFIARVTNYTQLGTKPDNTVDLSLNLWNIASSGSELIQDGTNFAPELENFMQSNIEAVRWIQEAAKECNCSGNDRIAPKYRNKVVQKSSTDDEGVCKGKNKEDCPYDITGLIDPSGFVYEAVENNRIKSVKATIYYKQYDENALGETVEQDVLWDAENYGQENPIYTDVQGMYHWDVPQGLWQVRFEKEGYESTQSEWLPVPPPQLEVNIPIVQLTQPEVQYVAAFATAIDIEFNKYMQPALLNTENIYVVANDQVIEGSIIFKNEMVSYEGEDSTYVSQLRFIPNSPFTAEQITLTISNRVRSYAGINMAETYQQTFDVAGLTPLLQAEAPTASIDSGSTVKSGTELYLTSTTPNAQIRYTFDGSDPTCDRGFVYNGEPIILTDYKSHIRAITCAEGYDPSEISDFTYVIDLTTSLETNSSNTAKITKILRDNQILILREGRTYTIMGTEIK